MSHAYGGTYSKCATLAWLLHPRAYSSSFLQTTSNATAVRRPLCALANFEMGLWTVIALGVPAVQMHIQKVGFYLRLLLQFFAAHVQCHLQPQLFEDLSLLVLSFHSLSVVYLRTSQRDICSSPKHEIKCFYNSSYPLASALWRHRDILLM